MDSDKLEWLFDDEIPEDVRNLSFEIYQIDMKQRGVWLNESSVLVICGVLGAVSLMLALIDSRQFDEVKFLGWIGIGTAIWSWVSFKLRPSKTDRRKLEAARRDLENKGYQFYLSRPNKIEMQK